MIPPELVTIIDDNHSQKERKPRLFFYNIQTSPFAPDTLFATVGDAKTKKFVQSGRLDILLARYFHYRFLFHNYTGALIDCAQS